MDKKQEKLEAVANNNNKQLREYNSLELKIFDTADHTLYILEEVLKTAINQEQYCSYIYDSLHPEKSGNYNACYRIEKILMKYEKDWKTNKQVREKDSGPSPIAPIKQIKELK